MSNETALNQAIRQAQKLLKLANHANTGPEEASTAAAKAQEIMDRFKIVSLAQLETPEVTEEIVDFAKKSAPLDVSAKLAVWKSLLAMALCRANQCMCYTSRRNGQRSLEVIGRPSDVETVRYLYAALIQDVDALAKRAAKGCGRTWASNYRHGVVEAIKEKLQTQRRATESDLRTAAGVDSSALVRIDTAIAKLAQRERDVAVFAQANLRLRTQSVPVGRTDPNARAQGREAGKSLSVGGTGRGLNSGCRRLGTGN